MAVTLTNFNVTPYNDDFDETKRFHRVMFRPGFSVQARELTQLQTILQDQVNKLGQHIFEQGAMVIPGDLNYDLEYEYVKLEGIFNAQTVENYRTEFFNKIIRSEATGLKARVIGTIPSSGDDPITLYVKYEDSGDDGLQKRFGVGETLTTFNADNTTLTNSQLTANQTTEHSARVQGASDSVGIGSAIQVHKGVYFVNGFFVSNEDQTILLDKYSNQPSYRIGFQISEQFITPEEDSSLLDNAQGSPNINAPGAHRFKMSLTLVKKSLSDTADQNFIELARIDNGQVLKFVKYSDYSHLEHTMARRTFDESGNYEVRPFLVEKREHLNDGTNRGVYEALAGGLDSKLAFSIEPGKAYVEGYELETYAAQIVESDKPRTFEREVDRPIQTPVGNYTLVQNVSGTPDIDTFEQLEVYDQFGGASGSGSVIGTVRARSFVLHDGDYSGTLSETRFKFGMFQVDLDDGFDFERDAKSIEGTNFSADISPSYVTVQGSATSSTSSTTVTGVGTLFTRDLDEGDYVYLNGNLIGRVDSITDNLEFELDANASAAVTGGTITHFSAKVFEPNRKPLVFDTNFFRIRKIRGDSTANPDNEQSTSYTIRRKFSPKLTEGTGDVSVDFTVNDNEAFTSASNLSNYTLVLTTATAASISAGRAVGDILDITSANISISGDGQTVTFSDLTNLTTNPILAGDEVELIASIDVSSTAAVEKSKTLQENVVADITTQANAEQTRITLGKADGYRLVSIKMASSYGAYSSSGEIDVTSRYTFDSGMRDAFYGLAAIVLKPGQPLPTGSLRVTFDYFTHGAGDYFSVDSYTGAVEYENIPRFISTESGDAFELRDCLDFRPRVDDNGNFVGGTASLTELPAIGTNVQCDFSYYLGRHDLIFMDRLGKFNLIKGVPSLNPQLPQAPDSGMVLFEVRQQAYVLDLTEVDVKKLDNRRYTMRDIGKLERRIKNLEFYTSLNLLEKETAALVVKDDDGNDRLKNGFIVDNFTGHIIGDISSADYRCSIDPKLRELRPMAFSDNVSMVETVSSSVARSSAGYKKHADGIITLPYEEIGYISNPYATDSFDVNPYKVAPFTGEITLIPYSDDWNDVTRRPDVIVNDDNNLDIITRLAEEIGITGTVWNSWQDNWFGSRVRTGTDSWSWNSSQWSGRTLNTFRNTATRAVFSQQVGQVRSGIRTTVGSQVESNSLGDRIVNISMVPFMRSRPILVVVGNMRPRTKMFSFFDNENVTDYCQPLDRFTITSNAASDFDFFNVDDAGAAASADTARYWEDEEVQAFAYGDVIRNQPHTATSVSSVVKGAITTTVSLTSTNGIAVGHHIQFTGIGGATQLNYSVSRNNNYLVTSVTGNDITIANLDGTQISTVSTYTSGGSAQRLRASGVASIELPDESGNANGLPRVILVSNIKNGFAVSDVCEGSVPRTTDGGTNLCTISAINGSSSTTTAPTMNSTSTDLITDEGGRISMVYYLPNTEELRFRTGERVFRLIDNINNNPEVGLHTSKAERVYRATGIAEEREQTILNVRRAEFVRDRVQDIRTVSRTVRGSVNVNRTLIGSWRRGHDPLGQTFINQGNEGAFITGIDLFFQTAGQRPVIVQLVDTVDGHPSNKIITQKVLSASEINTSDDASVSTRFTFDSPVYLKDDIEYAILVKVDEPGCRVFFSEVGQTNLTDNRVVSANPLTGTLFLSQNGQAWTPHQYRDLKFTLYRADFDTSVTGNPIFVNASVTKQKLKTNPFECKTDTNKVRVTQLNHGMRDGDLATISGVADAFYGANSSIAGIPADSLNATHTISDVTMDTYVIEIDAGDIVGGVAGLGHDTFGGAGITASRNLTGDIVLPAISQVKLPNTDITYSFNGMSTAYSKTATTSIQENENYYPEQRLLVASEVNQNDNLNGGRSANITAGTSAKLEAQMTSTNTYLSPVLDSQRVSLCMTSNRVASYERTDVNVAELDDRTVVSANTNVAFNSANATITTSDASTKELFLTLDVGKEITVSGAVSASNNKTYTIKKVSSDGATITVTAAPGTSEVAGNSVTIVQHENFFDSIAPSGTTNPANYITKRFTLENPATAIKILYEANRPDGADINIYYKIAEEGDVRDFDDIPYVLSTTDEIDNPEENYETFREREHTISGLNAFSTAAVKIEFTTNNTVDVARIKNLRVIALAL